MNHAFSKIWILVILAVFIAGGILAWWYFGAPEEEFKAPEVKVPEKIVEDETANWKIFIDREVGYSLKYPPDLKEVKEVSDEGLKNHLGNIFLPDEVLAAGLPPKRFKFKSDTLIFSIQTQKINNINEDDIQYLPVGPKYPKEAILQDAEVLKNGEFGYSMPFSEKTSEKVVKINEKIYGKTFTTLAEFEVCDVQFTRDLIFFKNGYVVNITLQEGDFGKILSELPQYFTIDKKNCGDWLVWDYKKIGQFYSDLVNGTILPETEAGIWYHTFDEIISTIDLFDVLPSKDETADWKTYRNEEYGYEIKYPRDGEVIKDTQAGGIRIDLSLASKTFLQPEDPSVIADVRKFLLVAVDKSIDNCSLFRKAPVQKSDEVMVGDIKFKKEIGKEYKYGAYSITYSTVHNRQCFRLNFIIRSSVPIFSPPSESDLEKETKIYNQMLSTFRFLE